MKKLLTIAFLMASMLFATPVAEAKPPKKYKKPVKVKKNKRYYKRAVHTYYQITKPKTFGIAEENIARLTKFMFSETAELIKNQSAALGSKGITNALRSFTKPKLSGETARNTAQHTKLKSSAMVKESKTHKTCPNPS